MQTRRVVISGISRGLGRAMVTRFRQLNHWVAGCRRTALSEDVLAEIGLEEWAQRAVELLLNLKPSQNGHSLDVDGVVRNTV